MSLASMPLQYKRLYDGPLDSDAVFESLQEALDYINGGTSYPGNIISVKDIGDEYKVYVLGESKRMIEVGTSTIINVIGGSFPTIGFQDKLYIDIDTGETRIYLNSDWKTLIHPIAEIIDDNMVQPQPPSADAVKSYISNNKLAWKII